jgi:hypothetical protein
MPNFTGDEYKDEINLEEWLRMLKKIDLSPFGVDFLFLGGASKW